MKSCIEHFTRTVFALSLLALAPVCCFAEEFRLLAWNVESNRPGQAPVSDSTVIAGELIEMMQAPATRSELIALSEVEPQSVPTLAAAAKRGLGHEVDFVTSASGGFQDSDTLMLIVDKTRFDILDAIELHRYAGIIGNITVAELESEGIGTIRARSPLAVKVSDKKADRQFWIIVNHLARSEAELRTQQANMLRQWAIDHREPIIAAGDFNFDFDFATQQGNDGFKAMMEGDVWKWLKPDPLIDTNWSDDRYVTDRRVDRYPDSILDFVFVANQAKAWDAHSDVVVRPGDFPDNDRTSDHRPLTATIRP